MVFGLGFPTRPRLSFSTILYSTTSLLGRSPKMDAATVLLNSSSSVSRKLFHRVGSRTSKLGRCRNFSQLRSLSCSGTVPWRWSLTAPPCLNYRRRTFSVNIPRAVSAASPKESGSEIGGSGSVVTDNDGFEKVTQQFIDECKSTAILYRHKKTGAEVMSVLNDDENKVFGIVFRTPPNDSTGIPHILEHSVLCGSRKYPLKEPFVELLKSSLNTFLNAFTYPDRTCFPVASTNTKDFYNLVDVYLDAVFFPKCIEDFQTFQQEGWHYELNNTNEDISFKGVVFNEMKGVYSQPDNILGRVSQQALFPDNSYGVDSGGDPEVIPKLSFEDFKDFHKKYYHPSNSRIWFYGDDDINERLRILSALEANRRRSGVWTPLEAARWRSGHFWKACQRTFWSLGAGFGKLGERERRGEEGGNRCLLPLLF